MALLRAPGGELSVRELGRPRGGNVVALRQERGSVFRVVNITIFVHGFNNDVAAARKSYQAHVRNLQGIPSTRMRGIFWFYWPGDIRGPRFLSMLTYPLMIDRADEAGQRLAEFLQLIPTAGFHVRFVAHSLGNRVVQEALRSLREADATNTVVDGVHLMAAAVPTTFCEGTGPFATRSPTRMEYVSSSTDDHVLRRFFPPGELFETVTWAEAVGRRGGPAGRWSGGQDTGLDHSDYWADQAVADTSAVLMGGSRPSRPPRERHLGRRRLLHRPPYSSRV